ncbi:hypothetical protein B0H13DRAFT_1924266 [Mycena leptocephala]|nr:hypothetical protein B0H13DRAFT_1924266 [Mycena leptocephala]
MSDTYFQPWFRDGTEKLRNALRQSGAIVSGSQIIQFFDRTKYPGSDMDIFLRIGGVLNMTRWLTAQGYHLDAKTEGYGCLTEPYCGRLPGYYCLTRAHRPIRAVYNYHRMLRQQLLCTIKIQLVVVDINPVQHVLSISTRTRKRGQVDVMEAKYATEASTSSDDDRGTTCD